MTRRQLFKVAIMAAALSGTHLAGAQSMAVNSTGAVGDASAILDVSSTTKGILLPRMDSAQRSIISGPATGLMVYQMDGLTPGFYYYNGTSWTALAAGAGSASGAAGGDLAGTYPSPMIANSVVTPAKLYATSGSPSATTFYRGDGSWNTPAGISSSGLTGTMYAMCGEAPNPGAGSSTSYGLTGGGSGIATAAVTAGVGGYGSVMTSSCTFDKLYMALAHYSGTAAETTTVTVYKNGSPTSMTLSLTMPASSAMGHAVWTSTTTGSFTAVAGDFISYSLTGGSTTDQDFLQISIHCY